MFPFLFATTLFVLSSGAPNEDRFSNLYSQPENVRLIAMASDYHPRGYQPRAHPDPHPHPHPRQHQERPTEADDEPRFSIGLGTLAPSYSQKFGVDGATRLDFNHRKDGFSYSLTNHHHPEIGSADEPQQQPRGSYGYEPSHESKHQRSPHIKIYHDQHIRERFLPQNAETRNFFAAIGPRQAYGSEGPSARDLIPNAERYRELVDTLAPKGRDEDGSGGGGGYGAGGFEGGDGYEEGPAMVGRGGYRYHGPGEGQGYKPYSSPGQGGPPPPSYTARANPNYQAPYHQHGPPESQWSGGDGSQGFDGNIEGFSEGSGFDVGGPFSEDGGFNSAGFGDDDVSMSPFSGATNNGMNVGLPKSFEFSSSLSSSPIGRSENSNALYLTDLSQLGLGQQEVITDQATLKSILGLR